MHHAPFLSVAMFDTNAISFGNAKTLRMTTRLGLSLAFVNKNLHPHLVHLPSHPFNVCTH